MAKTLGLKIDDDNTARTEELIAANGGSMQVTGTATVTIKITDHQEKEIVVHLSPDIKEEKMIISYKVMMDMGIL